MSSTLANDDWLWDGDAPEIADEGWDTGTTMSWTPPAMASDGAYDIVKSRVLCPLCQTHYLVEARAPKAFRRRERSQAQQPSLRVPLAQAPSPDMDGGRVITCSCGMFELTVAARGGEMPGARLVELNAALARSYEAHRLLSGVDFSRDTADEAVEPCGQNPRFQLHRDSGTPVLVATCERCNFCQPVL